MLSVVAGLLNAWQSFTDIWSVALVHCRVLEQSLAGKAFADRMSVGSNLRVLSYSCFRGHTRASLLLFSVLHYLLNWRCGSS